MKHTWLGLIACALLTAQEPASIRSTYTLGSDDQITIQVLDVEEIGRAPLRIDSRGNINLPLLGRVTAAGLTTEQLEAELAKRLKEFVHTPQVTVAIHEYRSQPVSILGSVNTPGVHQLQGSKTLLEMISLAGGLKPEAGHTVKITRRKEWGAIPLANAKDDSSGQFSVAEVSVREIMRAESPEQNIAIKPRDVITVPKADLIYVIGAVKKSGGFVLGDKEKVSALQALSMAEGMESTASAKNAKILRPAPDGSKVEIALDLKAVLAGKTKDLSMLPDDILFVPSSTGKKVLNRSVDAAIAVSSGIAIWRVGQR